MTGQEFVKKCFNEKNDALEMYLDLNSGTAVSEKIKEIAKLGVDFEELRFFINQFLNETYYTILMALDGEASLDGTQMTYQVIDEENNCINPCGELSDTAFELFMDEE